MDLRRRAASAPVLVSALLPAKAWACAVCIGWTDGQGLSAGYLWSWLLLSLLPFAVVAVIGVWIRHALRREARGRTDPP